MDEDVVEGLLAGAGGGDGDAQALFDRVLAKVLVEATGAQGQLDAGVLGACDRARGPRWASSMDAPRRVVAR